jgi:hypothetical protein
MNYGDLAAQLVKLQIYSIFCPRGNTRVRCNIPILQFQIRVLAGDLEAAAFGMLGFRYEWLAINFAKVDQSDLQPVRVVVAETLKSLASQDRNRRVTIRIRNESLGLAPASGQAQSIEARLDRHARG